MKFIHIFFWMAVFIRPAFPSLLQEQKQENPLQHTSNVVLKLVKVFVLDEKNRSVNNLEKSDFILYDNDRLQTVTDFERHHRPPSGFPETNTSPQDKTSSFTLSPEKGRKFFIFIDVLGNDEIGAGDARKAALQFLETKIEPEDEVGVLSYTPLTGFKVREHLTKDHEHIKRAINDAKENPLGPMFWVSNQLVKERAEISKKMGIEPENDKQNSIVVTGLAFYAKRPGEFARDISDVAKALRFTPGYKNVIFFSNGKLGASRYRLLGKEFASSNSPVFSINTTSNMVKRNLRTKKYAYDDSMKFLSEYSGGKYFESVKDFATVAGEIDSITGSYYVLGYSIDDTWDGKYHAIRVEVKKKGCRVLAQNGFYNPKPFSRYSELEKNFHLIDLAMSENPYFQESLELSMSAVPFVNQEKGSLLLLTELSVPQLLAHSFGKTELYVFIFDEDNTVVESQKGELDLNGFTETSIHPYFIASLPPGRYKCRIVIRDVANGKSTIGRSIATIPESSASGIDFQSPLFLIPGKKMNPVKVAAPEKQDVSFLDLFPILPENCSPLTNEMERGCTHVFGLIRSEYEGEESPEVEITGELVKQSDGGKKSLSIEIIDGKSIDKKTDVILIDISLPPLDPGDYEMRIIARESTTETRSVITRVFSVK